MTSDQRVYRKPILFFILFAIFTIAAAGFGWPATDHNPGKPAVFFSQGQAAYDPQNRAKSQREATQDFLSQAIIQAIGSFMSPSQMGSQYGVLQEKFLKNSGQYVETYQIFSEMPVGGLYQVRGQVTVAMEALRRELNALGLPQAGTRTSASAVPTGATQPMPSGRIQPSGSDRPVLSNTNQPVPAPTSQPVRSDTNQPVQPSTIQPPSISEPVSSGSGRMEPSSSDQALTSSRTTSASISATSIEPIKGAGEWTLVIHSSRQYAYWEALERILRDHFKSMRVKRVELDSETTRIQLDGVDGQFIASLQGTKLSGGVQLRIDGYAQEAHSLDISFVRPDAP